MKECVFFDLDGTLLDTLADLAEAGNDTLKKAGYETHPVEAYRQFVGSGLANMVRRAAPQTTEERVEAMRRDVVAYYDQHLMVHTCPYPGMKALAEHLHRAGCLLFVCTNKPQAQAEALTEHFFPGLFAGVYAQQEGKPIKPDPWAIDLVCRQYGFSKAVCILAGDSNVDVETAQNGGIDFVGASWGFRGEEELIRAGARWVAHDAQEMQKRIMDKE